MRVPFAVCAGGCVSTTPTLASTGVIVGTLEPAQCGTSCSGVDGGAGYRLRSIEVYLNAQKVHGNTDGVGLGGVWFDTGGSVVYQNLHGDPAGPCVVGVCLPLTGQVKTTGNEPTVYVLLPGGQNPTPLSVPIPPLCLYKNNDPNPCP